MNLNALSMPRFGRDTRLLLAAVAFFSFSFYGLHTLLRVLYILRLGHGPEYVGLFSAAGALTYMGMSLPSGGLGARYGAPRVMRIGGAVTVVGLFLTPLVEFMPAWAFYAWPIVSQVLLTAGWAALNVNVVPSLMALSNAANRHSAFAWSGVLRGLGTFLGTLVGGLLPGLFASVLGQSLSEPGPYRMALWAGGALAIIGLIPLFGVGTGSETTAHTRVAPSGRFPWAPVALTIGFVYLSHGGWATSQAFFNAYADTDLALPTAALGLLTGAGQSLAIVAPLLTPRLAARWGNAWTLAMASLGTALSLLLMAAVPHWAAAGLGRLGVLTLAAIWLPALQVYQMELVEASWRSLAYGAVSMAMGMAFASVSLIGGFMGAAWGYRSVFWLGVGMALAGATLMSALRLRRRR